MKPTDLSAAIAALIPTAQPLYLWGPPGIGKSSLVRQAAAACGKSVIDTRAVLLDPVDLRGIPSVNGNGLAHWCLPDFLPRDGQGVLFLDELAQAPPMVQSACLQLTLDRRIGEYVLPDGWSVIAASNRVEDRAGAHRIISPLLNRFIHLDLDVSNDDWQRWAMTSGIAPEVRSFLQFRPSLLFAFDPAAGARSFPTPRSWEFVSKVLPHVTKANRHAIVAGCVGDGPAAEFIGYLNTYQSLPNLDDVFKSADLFTVPTDPSILYALVGACAERARKATTTTLATLYKIASRLPTEYGVLLVQGIVMLNKQSLTLPEAGRWLATHRELLIGDAA